MSIGGAQFPKRPTDGRVLRSARTRDDMTSAVLEQLIVAKGEFHPSRKQVVADAGAGRTSLDRLFGSHRHLLRRIARHAPDQVVDAIGLAPETRAALSERDVKAIAWAVLAGRRLEGGF